MLVVQERTLVMSERTLVAYVGGKGSWSVAITEGHRFAMVLVAGEISAVA